ncbi:MAG TPA: VOC family protein [Chitinophagaceae bacterium]
MSVNPIPEGFHTITPYLHVQDVGNLIGFLTHAFDAKTLKSSKLEDGTIINAQLQIGDSIIELSEVRGDFQPMPCAIHLYVQDTDAVYKKAVEVGAMPVMEPSDQFYGDREAFIVDPSGNHWYIATRIENVSEEEMNKRVKEFMEEKNE